ncbi:hypothetical protein RI367_002544 [Sorochytrium milnesiophthora]
MLRLGDIAPDFGAQTTHGHVASLHRWMDEKGVRWLVLFSHPEDFTPVCTTELGAAAKMTDEWTKRGVDLLGLSCDDLQDHEQWVRDINETQGCQLRFPIPFNPTKEIGQIADKDCSIATLYGMLDSKEHDPTNVDPAGAPLTVRNVFIIDQRKRIRMVMIYPASTGRNFDEILRVIDSLQLHDRAKVTTPANWRPGDRVIVPPTMSTEDAKTRFGHVEEVKPYLRYVRGDV